LTWELVDGPGELQHARRIGGVVTRRSTNAEGVGANGGLRAVTNRQHSKVVDAGELVKINPAPPRDHNGSAHDEGLLGGLERKRLDHCPEAAIE
jgi:hypothetical protein